MDSNTVSNLPFMDFIANENEYKRLIPVPPASDLLEDGSLKQFMAFQRQHMIAMENSFKNIMDSNTKLAQSVQNLELTVQSLKQELKKTNKELEQIKKELRLTKSLSTLLLKKMGLMGKFQEFKDMGLSDDEILQKMAELLDEIPNERQGEFEEGVHGAVPNSRITASPDDDLLIDGSLRSLIASEIKRQVKPLEDEIKKLTKKVQDMTIKQDKTNEKLKQSEAINELFIEMTGLEENIKLLEGKNLSSEEMLHEMKKLVEGIPQQRVDQVTYEVKKRYDWKTIAKYTGVVVLALGVGAAVGCAVAFCPALGVAGVVALKTNVAISLIAGTNAATIVLAVGNICIKSCG